jgi:hypothetical protein
VAQVRPGEAAARGAFAPLVRRKGVVAVPGLLDRQRARGGEQHPVPRVARRKDAVEQVHPPGDREQDVPGRSHPHQVARHRRRQHRRRPRHRFPLELHPLADAHPADGEALKREGADLLDAAAPQIGEHPPLDDPEHAAALERPCREGTGRPQGGPPDGLFDLLPPRRVLHALVQHHPHVGPERLLNRHRELGGEGVQRSVDVGAERHRLVGHFPQGAQGEDLEPAAVGEDQPVPPHEPVEPPLAADPLVAGAQVQVVGVAEDAAVPHLPQLVRPDPLDRRRRPHGHERGRRERTAFRGNDPRARPGPPVPRLDREPERHLLLLTR